MRIEDFPKNKEIEEIRKAITDLEKTHSWEEIMLAKTDLNYLLDQREKWLNDDSR